MSADNPRMTGPTLKVIGQLMNGPLTGLSGADISKATGTASGTLYPILFRLEKAGWLCSEWEDGVPSEMGRPRKRLYQLTSLGAAESKAAFQDIVLAGGRLIWQS
jgi:PadR family transcriptional regulator PadR